MSAGDKLLESDAVKQLHTTTSAFFSVYALPPHEAIHPHDGEQPVVERLVMIELD